MRIKNKILLLFAAIMTVALIVAGVSFSAFAEEGEIPEGTAFKVEHADGTVTYHNPDSDTSLTDVARAGKTFSGLIENAVNGDKITAYTDFDLPSDCASLAANISIDLGGHTVTTTGRIFVTASYSLSVSNGTVDVTAKEFIYMGEWNANVSNTRVELKDIVAKNAEAAKDKYLLEIRAGSAVLDNVTVNEGEWVFASNAANGFISAGYKTRTKNQPINIEIKNSNINVKGATFVNAGGASGQASSTGGYALSLTIDNSNITATHYIARVVPASDKASICSLNMYVTGGSTLYSSSPVYVSSSMSADKVEVKMDYGVTSKKPKPAVGTVILGDDGNGVLDFVNGEFESSNTGTIVDLWSDNQTPVSRDDYAYTFVAVGDTQYITDSSNPEKLALLYDWIINNKDSQNIQFVFGMGDITNHSRDDEWPVAMEQLNRLNGVVPYSVVRGNHDTTDTFNANLNNETYRSMFEGFYSEDGAENAYVTFTVGEQDFLHITLDYHPSNAVLNWATGVIQQHPLHKVIISTHDYIQHDGSLSTSGGNGSTANSGEQMWNKLVSQHPNIFLVLSGHVYATDVGRSQMTGVYGNTVTAIITDGQCHDFKNGPMGLISLLHFSEDGKTLTVEYYSTVHNKFFGKNSQFTLEIPEFDLSSVEPPSYLYELTDANGNMLSFADTLPFSMVLSNVTAGSTLKLLGDVDVDSGCTAPADVTIDLNGYTLSTDGGRISGNCKITVTNGTVKIVNYELIYIGEGNTGSDVTFLDVDVVHTGTAKSKPLAEVRGGNVTLNNVRIAAE
ncbi:MAG: metallophosphoesterase, partial [Clostridia bacterium]|nr:metallophosphoesterase [Clostridia bacterium]